MGVLVLSMSLLVSVILIKLRRWFGLILFIIYVGGILVIFAYFLALCPNVVIRLGPMVGVSLLVALMMGRSFFFSHVSSSVEIGDVYLKSNFITYLVLGVCLFLAIVRVVKVSGRRSGALRPLN